MALKDISATCYVEDENAILRLLVLPHAGGSSKSFCSDWAITFTNAKLHVEVWGMDWNWNQYHADDRDLLKKWIHAVRKELRSCFFDKPYVLVGHSMGALAALELVEDFKARNFALPKHIFLSSVAGPSQWTLFSEGTLKSDATLIKLLHEEWKGIDPSVLQNNERREKLLQKLRGDLLLRNEIVRKHQETHFSLLVDTTVLGAKEDTSVSLKQLETWKSFAINSQYSVEITTFSGGHFYLISNDISKKQVADFLVTKLQQLVVRLVIETKTLIEKWNSKKAAYPEDKCLHDLFIAAAKRTPNTIAVYYEGKTLTFKQVDEMSDLLANYLYSVGVRPNKITAIFMEHCIEFVIAYIAALKAGGAYMPLEIVYPPDLLVRVMEESKPVIVLTKSNFLGRLPSWQQALCLDNAWIEELTKQTIPRLPADRILTRPDDLAYVVMSSGTTGVPKGICCPHRGAVHSYNWRLVEHPFLPDDRVACHVFFVWELLRPMLGNVPLYVIPDDVIYDPGRLVEYLFRHSITRILFTPSLLQLILDTVSFEELLRTLKSLRILWLCGEVVTIELRDRFIGLFPDCKLLNLYSVSECHDVSAIDLAHMSEFDNSLSAKYASCGEVMPNVRAYVLDDEYKAVTVGVPGELYIGGPCLAIGYLYRPEQTSQRFLENIVPGERVYKTGDRARYLPNGHLELIGRCDFMVKIRGYSVVLGAVESGISQHPLVSTAVVLTEGAEGSDKRLIAYIVPDNWEKVPTADAIREFLKEKLPHYAIPSVFVLLDALPINSASGKLDRKKIPSINDAKKLPSEDVDVALDTENLPQNDTQKKLADIWVELLRLESPVVYRKASFFDLGGHSLLATRLVSSIRDVFKASLTLADVLAAPQLDAIATVIDSVIANKSSSLEKNISLSLEGVLDPSIYPAPTRKSGYSRYRFEMVGKPPRHILLTGSTGFLGTHLLHALLSKTECLVYCLVRATDETKALERIHDSLKQYKLLETLESVEVDDRVIPIAGDLSKPLLGLEDDVFKMLATEVDAIIHNGAEVNLIKPYSALKSPNVLGTQEVLRLAVTNGIAKTHVKPVHYISTNGVFPSNYKDKTLSETSDLSDIWTDLDNGYSQSKWVAEEMCRQASSRGLPMSILRPGNMAPSSKTGVWNTSDFMYLMLRGCWKLCAVPARSDWYFDMTPVDFAANAIIHLAAINPSSCLGQTLHIQNPLKPVKSDAFFKYVIRTLKATQKTQPRTLEYSKWAVQLEQNKEGDIELEKLSAGLEAFDMYLKSDAIFDATLATALLKKAHVECPVIDQEILQTFIGTWK